MDTAELSINHLFLLRLKVQSETFNSHYSKSHDPNMLIEAQEKFRVIINVDSSCAAWFFIYIWNSGNYYTCYFQDSLMKVLQNSIFPPCNKILLFKINIKAIQISHYRTIEVHEAIISVNIIINGHKECKKGKKNKINKE